MKHLDAAYLARRLGADFDVHAFKVCTSTNTLLLDAARAGARAGTLFVAQSQTAGRGRMGRSFFSPEDTGIYCSLLLSPAPERDPAQLTALCALAVCEAAEALGAPPCAIKWVNDVYLENKKCCGILTQGIYGAEGLSHAVVGIGANLVYPAAGFPEEFASRAGAFFKTEREHLREDFVAECVTRLFYRKNEPFCNFVEDYRRRSNVLGRRVEVLEGEQRFFATARAIDETCRLVVEDEQGTLHTLNSEEVRLVL